ncbi:hypothetical protein [Streptomonospora salina]|uniref:Uncharacterized protein n=1 Tax=Streptomonospora salina TaxID=104205 RepID=A0A841E9W4_9ACTN|nr:hypothetical protein [Streptomonospora salina]MBB5998099.1 hypothetical protein [Streptomonospora salina]
MFYGSRPLGTQKPGSDLDALLVLDETNQLPHRRSATWRQIPVTVYVLARADLYSDGSDRGYGGYFALKLFGPFVTDSPSEEPALRTLVADFLAPLGHAVAKRWGQSVWTADQLLAHGHLAFLELYPDAASYLARHHRHRNLFLGVWAHQRAAYLAALEAGGHIHRAGEGLWRYDAGSSIDGFARQRSRCAARFWAWGAVFHDADPGFPDHYFHKADAAATRGQQDDAYRFLERVVAEGVLA